VTRPSPLPAPRPVLLALLALLTLLLLAARPATAQIPEKFENLKVFPQDVPHDTLVQAMRRIALALGVRCNYCHAGGDGRSLRGVNFASDEKTTKQKARFMLQMTDSLNRFVLAHLPDRSDPPVRVMCVTCHRGSPLPRTLPMVLTDIVEQYGADSAVAHYRMLRQTEMESGRYDLGELSLEDVARTLLARGRTADAVKILEASFETHPESANAEFALGDAYQRAGEKEKAIARYRGVLEKQPNNRQAAQRLRDLGATP
jgi:tetratricopeptide (TPR) repeat protein